MLKVIEKGLQAKGYYDYKNTDDFFEEIPNDNYNYNFEFKNLSILDSNTLSPNSLKIIADYHEEGYYNGYITFFLYTDGKILGKADYTDNVTPKENITGNYFLFENKLLLFIEWASTQSIIIVSLKEETIKYFNFLFSKFKIDKPVPVFQESKAKKVDNKKNTLLPLSNKQNPINFSPDDSPYIISKLLLLSELLRFGWSVSFTEHDNVIQISKDGIKKLVILHISAQKNLKWKINYKDGMEKMIHVFINVPKDVYEDYLVYNIKGSTIQNWVKKNSYGKLTLSSLNDVFSKYEYNWSIFE